MSRWAIVTGASRGLGAEFARQLSAQGWSLVLTARDQADLTELQRSLPTPTRLLAADLTDPQTIEQLVDLTADLPIELLVNNAGFGTLGDFAEQSPAVVDRMMALNITALVQLTHRFGAQMKQRGRGAILNVASTAAFFPLARFALYAATKAFVLHFSLGLHHELKRDGVWVTAVCPGPTETHFFSSNQISTDSFGGHLQPASGCVREALQAMVRHQPLVITGARNRWLVRLTRWVPVTVLAFFAAIGLRQRH